MSQQMVDDLDDVLEPREAIISVFQSWLDLQEIKHKRDGNTIKYKTSVGSEEFDSYAITVTHGIVMHLRTGIIVKPEKRNDLAVLLDLVNRQIPFAAFSSAYGNIQLRHYMGPKDSISMESYDNSKAWIDLAIGKYRTLLGALCDGITDLDKATDWLQQKKD